MTPETEGNKNKVWRKWLTFVVEIIVAIISLIWLIHTPSEEPLLAVIASTVAVFLGIQDIPESRKRSDGKQDNFIDELKMVENQLNSALVLANKRRDGISDSIREVEKLKTDLEKQQTKIDELKTFPNLVNKGEIMSVFMEEVERSAKKIRRDKLIIFLLGFASSLILSPFIEWLVSFIR